MCSLFINVAAVRLVPEREDNVQEEQDAVCDGQTALGWVKVSVVVEASQQAVLVVIPVWEDDSAGSDEQGRSDQTEENIDSLIDRRAQYIACDGQKLC